MAFQSYQLRTNWYYTVCLPTAPLELLHNLHVEPSHVTNLKSVQSQQGARNTLIERHVVTSVSPDVVVEDAEAVTLVLHDDSWSGGDQCGWLDPPSVLYVVILS